MRALLSVSLGFVVIALSSQAVGDDAATRRPNVLFLICDDLNCDLGCYGHPLVRSPNIDRLAARGVRFERAYCQYPLCGPSRASFMTGLYPDQTLIHQNSIYIREHVPNVQTMSQMFRKNGYFATRIGKIYHFGVPGNIGSGGHDDPYSWDYTINPRGRDKDEENLIFSLIPGNFGGTLSWHAADGADAEQTDGIAATEAVELLRRYARDERPFYLAVGLYRPHTPYVAPKTYFELYPRDKLVIPAVPAGYLDSLPASARKTVSHKKEQFNLPEELARQAIQAYYASITFADVQLGRILDTLDSTGLAENTVVLFTSDHGYHMGEHGHWQKTTLFENAAHVPLIIAGPGVTAAGQSTPALAEMVDFYPTLA
ncbi:MAG: sulfatase, partial [Planctomycetaceae bacterium]